MQPAISIQNVSKRYSGGHLALNNVSLDIQRGEIFALLGPNGAGKTTLISTICGIARASAGRILIDGHDTVSDFRAAREQVGLVPQEIQADSFESVISALKFSRGLFGKRPDTAYLEKILQDLSLWDKRDAKIITLSGGMKRRVMIAKALAHEPKILFLDEPTAGVDVELRKSMWDVVRKLRDSGVTMILTTHYIEEAEEMADRVGVINRGEIILVENKHTLMQKMGAKQLKLQLDAPLHHIPAMLANYHLAHGNDPQQLIYTFDTKAASTGISDLLRDLALSGLTVRDLETTQSSLEEIFISLVRNEP